MMCLGWYNRPTCAPREQVEVLPAESSPSCPTAILFWITAGVILLTGSKN